MAKAAEPGEQIVFEGVGEFEQFLALDDLVDVLEDQNEIIGEAFDGTGADVLAVRKHFDGLGNKTQSEEGILQIGHEIPPHFFGLGPFVDHDLEGHAFHAFVEGVNLVGGDADELKTELIETDGARGDFVEGLEGRHGFAEADGDAVDREGEKDAIAFQGHRFQLGADGVQGLPLLERKIHRVPVQGDLDARDRRLSVGRTLHIQFIGGRHKTLRGLPA